MYIFHIYNIHVVYHSKLRGDKNEKSGRLADPVQNLIASVPGLPFYLQAFIVRGRDTLKTGKAWDDTSREDRRKVTQRHVASTTYIKVCIHWRAFDVHTGA